MDFEFQTSFEILLAVEGFSAWKGKSFIGWGSLVRIEEGPALDEERFRQACDGLSEQDKRSKSLRDLTWMYTCLQLRRVKYVIVKFTRSLLGVLYNALAFALRCSPVVSIPLMAAAYFLQWGCKGENLQNGHWLFVFICAKTACFVACAVINAYLESCTRIATPKLKSDADGIGKLN
ncbi:MAG: hypothetical protein MJ249_08115 [Kiritimatiellae bacterium]|nr:hypothetical protein [Kiritimatiellia bacterium]